MYEIFKFDKGVYDENDYEWKAGYPPSEASYDESKASYDRVVENDDEDD